MPTVTKIEDFRAGPETTADDLLHAAELMLDKDPMMWGPARTTGTWWHDGQVIRLRYQYTLRDMIIMLSVNAPVDATDEALERLESAEPWGIKNFRDYGIEPGLATAREWIARAREQGTCDTSTIVKHRAGNDATADQVLEAVDRLLDENPGIWHPFDLETWWPGSENRRHIRRYSLATLINQVGMTAATEAVEEALERVRRTEPPEVSGHDLNDPHPGPEAAREWIARARQLRQ